MNTFKRTIAIPTAKGEKVFTIPADPEHAAHLERVAREIAAPYPDEGRLSLLSIHNAKFNELLCAVSMIGVTSAADIKRRLRKAFALDARFMGRALGCTIGYSRAQITHFNAERRAGK
jgi:hypothetical protein